MQYLVALVEDTPSSSLFYMREFGVTLHGSPVFYRYIDWLITVPLQMIEFDKIFRSRCGGQMLLFHKKSICVLPLEEIQDSQCTGYIGRQSALLLQARVLGPLKVHRLAHHSAFANDRKLLDPFRDGVWHLHQVARWNCHHTCCRLHERRRPYF